MPDELKVSPTDEAADKTSPAEVAAAYEAAIEGDTGKEEAKVEVKEEVKEELKDEKQEIQRKLDDDSDLDQHDRTRLGRRLKRVEEGLAKLDRLGELLERMERPTSRKETETSESEIPEVITTAEDVRKVNRFEKQNIKKRDGDYQTAYIKHIHSLETEDDPIHEEVIKELFTITSPFNVRRGDDDDPDTWNPRHDAEVNYYKAKVSVLAKKVGTPSKPKPNVKGERPLVSADVSTELTMKERSPKEVKLDPYAQEYLNIVGATDAQRKKYASE